MTYKFKSLAGREVEVEADTEEHARRKAMIILYGSRPDDITPHAPAYAGRGLIDVTGF